MVVFSGAGISTDSGIQDFRGPAGVWTLSPGAQKRHTFQAFMADPELRVSYWKSRFEHPVWNVEPNAGHRAVAGLADSEIETTVITQNTDGLHQRAGTPEDRVFELHGSMHTVVCVACGHLSPTTGVLDRIAAGDPKPPCLECGGILKTASTMFGQTMSPEVFVGAQEAVSSADLVLAVGTTLTVEPAGSLCAGAVHAGATLVIVNWDPTPYDAIANDLIRDPLSEVLPVIVEQLRAGRHLTAPKAAPVGADPDTGSSHVPRPSRLLRVTERTARFRSGEAELDRLTEWCTGTGARTRLVVGPAGSGKTRLALEMAERLGEKGGWHVAFPALGAGIPAGDGPLLVVLDEAETRQEQVTRILAEASARPAAEPTRVLLLARTQEGWWDELSDEPDDRTDLTVPDDSDHERAVRDAAHDYAAALSALGHPCPAPQELIPVESRLPGELQTEVLAEMLGQPGRAADALVECELAYLRRSAAERELGLPAEVVVSAAATAVLCGAHDEQAALDVLGHLSALENPELRLRVAEWLRELYPSAASDASAYWNDALPDALTEGLIAAIVTPRLLMGIVMESTEEQDRRALTVLARAAHRRPELGACLTELLTLLPGVSPAAVDVAVRGGYPTALVDALTSLARTAPLPADLLDLVPSGSTLFGQFPVLLAESLVEAYEGRAQTQNGLLGLTKTLIQLAERLADLGNAPRAVEVARRAVETAARLDDPRDYSERAAKSLRRRTTRMAG